MLPRQITYLRPPDQANSFVPTLLRPLELSCRSFCNSDPLFSIPCSLFSQNTRGMGASLRRLFPLSVSLPTASKGALSPPIDFLTLCFHSLTNPFSRNSFPFKSIQNPGVWGANHPLHAWVQVMQVADGIAVRSQSGRKGNSGKAKTQN
jgi:hypothetical protein